MIADDVFVLDAVTHAYNLDESNYAIEPYADMVSEMIYNNWMAGAPEEYTLPMETYLRDWDVEETADMLFCESDTDLAVFHPTPIGFYEDGLVSVEKAKRIQERWPNRFLTYATVDPLADDAIPELERQVEEMDPVGLKLYPSSWATGDWESHEGWRMDDPEVAYPVFERAKELGLDVIAVHKTLPLGPVPMDPYRVDDIEGAATSFPELNFSIVHGGMAFTEETAWQLARYPNIYVNLETVNFMAVASPRRFAKVMAGLLSVGGPEAIDRIYWGTGAMGFHPQPIIEAFWEFEFPDDLDTEGLLFDEIPDLTEEHKRKILGENYADMIGLDLDEVRDDIEDDEFSRQHEEDGIAEPYSTMKVSAD